MKHNNRQLKRGQAIVSLAMAWRGARSSKDPALREVARECFGAMCRKVDRMNAEDRDGQRLPLLYVMRIRIAHWLIDLG